jgi:FkbM family methyltransferase
LIKQSSVIEAQKTEALETMRKALASFEQQSQQFMSKLSVHDAQYLDWIKLTTRTLTQIRGEGIGKLAAKLDEFDDRLVADLRARAAYLSARDTQQNMQIRDLARAIGQVGLGSEDTRPNGRDPASTQASTPNESGKRPHSQKSIENRGATASLPGPSEASPPDRKFGLRTVSVNPELEGLLSLQTWASEDPQAAVVLSKITTPALRSLYPADVHQRRTIALRSGLDLDADVSDIFAASAALGWVQEADDFELFMNLVEEGATIVDVGANFGIYACHAGLYAGAEGRVFAFEPIPETHQLLVGNVQANGLADRCKCFCAAVGSQPGEAVFHIMADSVFSGLHNTGRSKLARTISTEVIALDSHPLLREVDKIELMKIDVEGAEAGVFAGAHELFLRSPDVIVMFEFSYKNMDDETRAALLTELEWLEGHGFDVLGWPKVGVGMQVLRLGDLDSRTNENLFLCKPSGPARRRLEAAAQCVRRRTISPDQAAALSLLKSHAKQLGG